MSTIKRGIHFLCCIPFFQVVNYGIGGHFSVHSDAFDQEDIAEVCINIVFFFISRNTNSDVQLRSTDFYQQHLKNYCQYTFFFKKSYWAALVWVIKSNNNTRYTVHRKCGWKRNDGLQIYSRGSILRNLLFVTKVWFFCRPSHTYYTVVS